MTNHDIDSRIKDFEEYMQPVMHLFAEDPVDQLEYMGFFDAPASAKHHGAYEGGLFEHSSNVAHILSKLTKDNHLEWKRPESPLIIGMFHDLCKSDEYRHPKQEPLIYASGKPTEQLDMAHWVHNSQQLIKGHGDKSVMLLSQFLPLTLEEIACIRYHMGAFTDRTEWGDYDRAIRFFPNVLWTHHADMIASQIIEGSET